MKVFIVDDSKIVCERLIEMLSELPGVEIAGKAHKVVEATNLIEKIKPDVVILDIRMPGGSGIDILRKIKKNKAAPLVIMLTNYPYPQYRKKCMDAGGDFFFDKSDEFEKVVEVLKDLIQSSI